MANTELPRRGSNACNDHQAEPVAWHNSKVVGTGSIFRLAALALVAGGLNSCGTKSDTRAGPFPVDSGNDTGPSDDAGPASPDADAGNEDATQD